MDDGPPKVKAPRAPKAPKAPRTPKAPKAKTPAGTLVVASPTSLAYDVHRHEHAIIPQTAYDPRVDGARCDVCPLRERHMYRPEGWRPVADELRPGTKLLLVGEAPGETEELDGRPFVGKSGQELLRVLGTFGLGRQDVSFSNVLACRPLPANDLNGMLYRLSRDNKKIEKENVLRVAQGLTPYLLKPSPIACCWPRLRKVLAKFTYVIALGNAAARYCAGTKLGVMQERGAYKDVRLPLDAAGTVIHAIAAVPTVHPAFVLRTPRWRQVLLWDIWRALQWFSGNISWRPPQIKYQPTPEELYAFLWAGLPLYAYDVETDGKEPMTANLRCIGIGTSTHVMMVGFLSIDKHTRFYAPEVEKRILGVLIPWLESPDAFKVGQNSGVYDTINLLCQIGARVLQQADTLVCHKNVASELPHNLDFIVTTRTDAPKWKTDREGKKKSTESESDEELHVYCLAQGVPIVLADRSTRPIESIIHQLETARDPLADPIMVRSRTPEGLIVSRRVIGWHKNRVPGQTWVQIHTGAHSAPRGLVVTPDHRILTENRGEVLAGAIVVGDTLLLEEPRMSADQEDAVLGTLLGDASLTTSPAFRGREANACGLSLVFSQRADTQWAEYKAEMLAPYVRCITHVPATTFVARGRKSRRAEGSRVCTEQLHQLVPLWSLLYDESRTKRLPIAALERLGPRGFAWWFMDDGCRGARTGAGAHCLCLATDGFPREDVERAAVWFTQRFGKTTVFGSNVLSLKRTAAVAFSTMIAPYIIPPMRYKLPDTDGVWPAYRDVPVDAVTAIPVGANVTRVGVWDPPRHSRGARLRAETRYCLTVEETHNFFTTYGLVANCAYDVAGTALVAPGLIQEVTARGQSEVCALDHRLQGVAVGLKLTGMYIDQRKRYAWEHKLKTERAAYVAEVRGRLGMPTLNIFSTQQMNDVLFEKMKLIPVMYTETDTPCLDDDAIRMMMLAPTTPEELRLVLLALRKGRRTSKYLGTYVTRFRPHNEMVLYGEDGENEDLDDEEREYLETHKELRPGQCFPDGRLHADWNILPVTGRFNCGNPNLMNCPSKLKDIFTASPGNILVGVDSNQIELRINAARWHMQRYLDVLAREKIPGVMPWECDPHIETMKAVFGEDRVRAMEGQPNAKKPKGGGTFSKGRTLSKRVIYASFYGANSQTVYDVVTSAENDAGDLVYADVPFAEIVTIHEGILSANPTMQRGWTQDVRDWQRDGYLCEPVFQRRRDFLDSARDKPERNEIVNFRTQGSASSIVHISMFRILDRIPFGKWGPGTGMINQCHDSITIECPVAEAEWVGKFLTEAMTLRVPCYDVDFYGESAMGHTWGET